MSALFFEAIEHHQNGRLEQAESLYQRVLSLYPQHSEALDLLGVLYCQLGRHARGFPLLRRAIELSPNNAETHVHLAIALQECGQIDDSCRAYLEALKIEPSHPSALINLGVLYQKQNRPYAMLSLCRDAVARHPNHFKIWDLLGCALQDLKLPREAEQAHRQAIKLAPDTANTWTNLGNALFAQDRLQEAEEAHRQAIALAPHLADAYVNLGVVLQERNRRSDAVACFRKALELGFDDCGATLAHLIHNRLLMADWDDIEADIHHLLEIVKTQPSCAVDPFLTLAVCDDPEIHLRAAQHQAKRIVEGLAERPPLPPLCRNNKGARLRIGYLSADFHQHPTSILLVSVLEKHNRNSFEIFAYSFGPDDKSALRKRIENACDGFLDVINLSSLEIAERIRADSIDILIDLKGYTRNARPEILALRPAPLQIQYLGYPGTMGASFIHGVVVDPIVTPPTLQPWFTERLLFLPNCYQANDSQRKIADAPLSRAMFGLPNDGFVYCCFNAINKISPTIFNLWLKILDKTPGSVLWLLSGDENAPRRLRRVAAVFGIDPGRIIFAPRQPAEQFRACFRLADLFLDTFPYNAHTTASDALWAGLPVLTCPGKTFPSRVGASLLHTLGLSELIATTWNDYHDFAVRLASSPQDLAMIRQRLIDQCRRSPLFDDQKFVEDFESALAEAWRVMTSEPFHQPR